MSKVKRLPGLKEIELVRLGACAVCREPLAANDQLTFYRVAVSHLAFDARAVRRRFGLGMAIGSDAIARVMGPDEDLAKVLDGPREVVVHEGCADRIGHLMSLMEESR